jgi:hypothetical protein
VSERVVGAGVPTLKFFVILGLLIFGSIPNFAHAQQLMNFITRTTIPIVIQCPGCNARNQNKNSLSTQRLPLERLTSVAPSANFAKSLDFRSSETLRRANLKQFAQKTRSVDPAGADQMEQMFASTDVIAAIGKWIAPYGLRTNNVADAYTVYWTNAWLGSRGRNDTLPKAQVTAVRNQAANALLSSPEFTSASDSQKQEMAEALLIQAALIEASIESAKSDPSFMSKVKAAIAQGAEGMGLDLYRMTLTNKGFVPAKQGSALDKDKNILAAKLSQQVLASNIPVNNAPNYALIAAAGSASLGGMFLLGKAVGRKS